MFGQIPFAQCYHIVLHHMLQHQTPNMLKYLCIIVVHDSLILTIEFRVTIATH